MQISNLLPIDWIIPAVARVPGGPGPGLGDRLGFATVMAALPGLLGAPVVHEVSAALPHSQLADGVVASLTKGVG